MAKQAATKASKTVDKAAKIYTGYINHVLENGKEPASVYRFMKDLKMDEVTFYNHYNSFSALRQHIWLGFLEETIANLHSEEAFLQYTAREKLLALYFTLIEVLKENRSYVLIDMKLAKKPGSTPDFMKAFKHRFLKFADEILLQAKETEEVIDRPVIGDRYKDGLWLQTMFVLQFWVKDDSIGFEKTDAAIEKAVNVAFDLMGKSPLDSMVDFAKFLFQNR